MNPTHRTCLTCSTRLPIEWRGPLGSTGFSAPDRCPVCRGEMTAVVFRQFEEPHAAAAPAHPSGVGWTDGEAALYQPCGARWRGPGRSQHVCSLTAGHDGGHLDGPSLGLSLSAARGEGQ